MGNPTRKTDRGSEKIKESVVRPQKPSQIDAAGNIKERQITLAAGEGDNLKEWTRLDSATLARWTDDRLAWRSLSYNVSTMSPLRVSVKGLIESDRNQ